MRKRERGSPYLVLCSKLILECTRLGQGRDEAISASIDGSLPCGRQGSAETTEMMLMPHGHRRHHIEVLGGDRPSTHLYVYSYHFFSPPPLDITPHRLKPPLVYQFLSQNLGAVHDPKSHRRLPPRHLHEGHLHPARMRLLTRTSGSSTCTSSPLATTRTTSMTPQTRRQLRGLWGDRRRSSSTLHARARHTHSSWHHSRSCMSQIQH